jgi:tetratricopeptide (TPR) repeat protein
MVPSIETLTARFLARQAIAPEVIEYTDVTTHEAIASFRPSTATTWRDAVAGLTLFGEKAVMPPPDWANLVSQWGEASIMPLCIGAVPQRVHGIQRLKSTIPTNQAFENGQFPQLHKWIRERRKANTAVDLILAAAMLRTLGEFAEAGACLDAAQSTASPAQLVIIANERAAILWHQGEFKKAKALWSAMADHPAIVFNRACCDWVMGQMKAAESAFDSASQQLPDTCGWCHLAGLSAIACGE